MGRKKNEMACSASVRRAWKLLRQFCPQSLPVIATVASAVAAIASAIVAWNSYKAQRLANAIAAESQNPLFVFESYCPELELKGFDPYWQITTTGVRLKNYGGVPREIHSIQIRRIWEFSKGWKVCVLPISDYYGLGDNLPHQSCVGMIAEGYNISNHWHEVEMMTWCVSNKISFVSHTLSYVDYTTRFGSRITKYFRDSIVVDGFAYSNQVNRITPKYWFGLSYKNLDRAEIIHQLTDR